MLAITISLATYNHSAAAITLRQKPVVAASMEFPSRFSIVLAATGLSAKQKAVIRNAKNQGRKLKKLSSQIESGTAKVKKAAAKAKRNAAKLR